MKAHYLLKQHQRAAGYLESICKVESQLAELESDSHVFDLPWAEQPWWATFKGAKERNFVEIETKRAVIAKLQRSYAAILDKINQQ